MPPRQKTTAAPHAERKAAEALEIRRKKSFAFMKLRRSQDTRYFIRFTMKRFENGKSVWSVGAWPLTFKSRKEATLAIEALPVFANSDSMPGRGRIRSVSVERCGKVPTGPFAQR